MQKYLAVYRDKACTNVVSQHYGPTGDTNPITPARPIIIPYAGVNVSDLLVYYIKAKPGFTTIGETQITIIDYILTGASAHTDNRWMISLSKNMEDAFWGTPVYISKPISGEDQPIPLYIKCRTLGPVNTVITDSQDAVVDDYSVHLLIECQIARE